MSEPTAAFVSRHIGPRQHEIDHMLAAIGYESLDDLSAAAVPEAIQAFGRLNLPEASTEAAALAELRELARGNQPLVQMIGLGYSDTVTPPVVIRRLLENPGWYTAYTPYQPEISQGRLEALLNFQTMVGDLTGLPVANASLLDESTAVAEAVTVMRRSVKGRADRVLVDADVLPQTLAVLHTRCRPLKIEIEVADLTAGLPEGDFFGVVVQYPGASGALTDPSPVVVAAHERGMLVAFAADLLSLCLLKAPGEIGADIVVGSSQRFGVPLGYGGPHAGFMAVRTGLERAIPGRLVGVSVDADGKPAYRLALQTREQHIRREKATSNICTAQVLLAVIASMYAVWHGPQGLRAIAEHAHHQAAVLATALRSGGLRVVHDGFFDTLVLAVPGNAAVVVSAALEHGINIGFVDDDHVRIACDERTTDDHLTALMSACGLGPVVWTQVSANLVRTIPASLVRESDYLTHPVFNTHRSETSMLRYLHELADRDYALDRGMIPLGSCTMKLNSTTEMEAITWPEFAQIHPFAPVEQASGYLQLIRQLESWLVEITGYDAVSLQPNAGSQGEFAGLLAIHAYHQSRGESHRDVCLIPSSAHGTNAASAVMAGLRVVVVAAAGDGTIDMDDLRAKIDTHRDNLAAIMVTYPSTHGVYEDTITELCAVVHDAGGQVYVDGANLNALVGLARPGKFGADVSHLNLHKTFCIPHGGGGPGVGPVAVRSHLAPFLPNHPMLNEAGPATGVGPVSGAPFGSASILPISWAYIRMMGPDGLKRATQVAVLAANYMANRLAASFPILYTGRDGLVAHECIVDLRGLTAATGVTVDDVAKRLVDYGFHAPTMSFPVAGTLMIEPTESEDLREIDRFIDAMVAIKAEIDQVAAGEWAVQDSPLRHAPHTAASLTADWPYEYTREHAVFPAGVHQHRVKYWPPVRRIDGAFGDRNLVCSCPAPEAFEI